MGDEETVQLYAELGMLGFLIEVMLANGLASLPTAAAQDEFISRLLDVSKRTDCIPLQTDEARAVLASDIVVRMQERIAAKIEAALTRARSGK